MDETNSLSGHSNHTADPRDYTGVELGSNRLKASALIPDWLLCEEPMPWVCDGRTLTGSGAQPVMEVRGCVALWCGLDPDAFVDALAFSDAIAKWRTDPHRWRECGVPAFLQALDLAVAALGTGKLRALEVVQDIPEATLVTVESFKQWADQSSLVRPLDPRLRSFPWGRHKTTKTDLFVLVMHKHYRLQEDGGTYDPNNRTTHPFPEDIRATLRSAGCRSRTLMDQIYAVSRDPRIPVGRRKRGGRSRR